jgi:endothelin-converting enzyme
MKPDYDPPRNEIVFPAGIMQFPLFNEDIPEYMNYGAFGTIAGHELSHAFDSHGRHFDVNGSYSDWWDTETVHNFNQRAECFVKQYSNYTIKDEQGRAMPVNGRLTLGENIADSSGIVASFSAWKNQAAAKNMDLPGLESFTHDQLFFISAAMPFCSRITKQAQLRLLYTDTHSPHWVRVLGATANSREFREAFNCPVKRPECELW